MNNISVLDCTLRDGGYCNQWNFGEKNIKKIINDLVVANIDIIECGFITNKATYSPDISKFNCVEQLKKFIPKGRAEQQFVAMINYGEINADELQESDEASIDGIRVAFHKKDIVNAMQLCHQIKEKGYNLFVQPMVTMNYSDEEFEELIRMTNELKPYAFYIVDSFGTMRKKTLLHYYNITQNLLNTDIAIGFHSHNNFQAAYSNAINILENNTQIHKIIIDSSVYGMGRGAGNLNTEILINELNTEYGKKYQIKPILHMMDEVINYFYEKKPWGYSLPNYLSAAHLIHPNYAIHFCEKNTLTIDAMDDIFEMMDREKTIEYDYDYAEMVYEKYMREGYANNCNISSLKEIINCRKVLLIAPGKNSDMQKERIRKFVKEENPIVIGINHKYEYLNNDYIFVSNMRRYKELPVDERKKTIITNNIKSDEACMCVDYFALLNESSFVKDNAGLMAIKLMSILGCKKVFVAGYDGYDYASDKNYENKELELVMSKKQIDTLNEGMAAALHSMLKQIEIEYITDSRFYNVN